ncbi:glycoside hydrolase, family 18 [Alkaliphilus metalliredigens QYMF]|uniref:Glycoside hydrolase, family 18 n=1 Tax=Alkaliphilus metalliredigens (strain QYMF) TaxID=293826 RepID=A6TM83_ALKMQ|nr:glycosyl hydrolase family 18 protein [Alkaliphilus metalliredigens]ABR47301.1 glycoside hydrolase, family 18 [Alkaliphilus metalliredigens QYMF]
MRVIRVGLILLILLVVSGASLYYLVEGNPFQGETGMSSYDLIVEDTPLEDSVIIEEQEVYLPYELVEQWLTQNVQLQLDEETEKIEMMIQKIAFSFENPRIDEFVKKEPVNLNFYTKKIDGKFYVPIKSLAPLLGISVVYNEENGVVMIDLLHRDPVIGALSSKASLRQEPRRLSKRKVSFNEEDVVRIYNEVENYYYVRTEKGALGYVSKAEVRVVDEIEQSEKHHVFNIKQPWEPVENIGLVWDYIGKRSPDRSHEKRISAVDVYSPTWFRVVDEKGTIENKGDFSYARDLTHEGYEIWALITNSFDPDLTSKLLGDQGAQEQIIRQLLIYSALYDLGGINIDFENIHYEDRDRLTDFVDKFTDYLHEQNLVISIDVTIPSMSLNWSKVYDRERLGQIVDYVAVMTYDEHWAASPKSGSVASIGWVERGIRSTLELVPPEKILLGLPFYTRLWEEVPQANGSIKVSSKAYGMNRIMEILMENEASIIWNEETGQYYSEFQQEGSTFRVWLEDQRSLGLKTTLVHKYQLAGVAAWRKDFEVAPVWETIQLILKESVAHEQIVYEMLQPSN